MENENSGLLLKAQGLCKTYGERKVVDNVCLEIGNGAAVIVDKKNNVRITGAKQSTSVSNLRNQVEKQQKTKK